MRRILITAGEIEIEAALLDTLTADAIYNALPFEGYARLWGDEIYFEIPVKMNEEAGAREEVEVGDLAFWPIGPAFCIFFGRTPVSTGNKPRAYSPVNVFGKIEGSVDDFKKVDPNSFIQVKKLQDSS